MQLVPSLNGGVLVVFYFIFEYNLIDLLMDGWTSPNLRRENLLFDLSYLARIDTFLISPG